ncbi:MAG: deoxyribodipyrimidine photo-lyase [Cyclobacteriaceae bacterium]
MNKQKISIFWFRRDLRIDDNAGLYHALKGSYPVLPVFIFDTTILDKLEDKTDARVTFIHKALESIQQELESVGSSLLVKNGDPLTVWRELLVEYDIQSVYTNHDYEPYGNKRDQAVSCLLAEQGIEFTTHKDQVIFEKGEVTKDDGKPYTVFTPYSRKWKAKLTSFYLKPYPTKGYVSNFLKEAKSTFLSLEDIGFQQSTIELPTRKVVDSIFKQYGEQRDFPAVKGTSRLGLYLRFGVISIRKLANYTKGLSETYLNELIWRDFYMMILHHHPRIVEESFKPKYDRIQWRNNEEEYEKWCNGQTGYPIVDAGMRELNATGFMHNRVRMIVASFLTKHLLIDWRWGEAYFAKKLLDFDLSANNGGWQWAAGTGCDAAPYFRVFNPYTQTDKFDKKLEYVKKWVPEFQGFDYAKPIVEHKFARERALLTYKEGLEAVI